MKKQTLIGFGLALTAITTAFALVNAPSGFFASSATCGSAPTGSCIMNLSWADNSSNETGFKIERKDSLNPTWVQIATVGANVTSTTVSETKGSCKKTAQYRIRAYNATENSAYANSNTYQVYGLSFCE
jgi:hypothetical protein